MTEPCAHTFRVQHASGRATQQTCLTTALMMRTPAVLINTSRGALVDEPALGREVRRRPLYMLLDVTDPEPPARDSALRREPNILLTLILPAR